MARGAQRFRNLTLPKQPGELGRLRVLGGPDMGTVFVFTAAHVTLGRGDDNDIILSDTKVSRHHAEITLGNAAFPNTMLKDLGSSHGTLVNGVSQKQTFVKSGDKIGIGESVLEFISSEAGATRMIVAPPVRSATVVGTGTSGLTQFIPRAQGQAAAQGSPLGALLGAGGAALAGAQKRSFIEKNKKMIVILGLLMAASALLPEVEQKQRAKKKYSDPKEIEAERALGSLNPVIVEPAVARKAEQYFKEGFREFRARNYLRAQTQFETALQIYGDHSLARIYLNSTRKAMEDEAKTHFKDAKRDEEANRIKSALLHYDAVRRLYARDQSNPLYKQAETRTQELEKRIKDGKN